MATFTTLGRQLLRFTGMVQCQCKAASTSASKDYDICIVGGGIVGLATAQELIGRHPHLKLAVVEKETKVAQHQSGHNSGVMHAGIYYTPGSLKAKLCVEGLELAYKYCDKHNIPYKKVGKLIVATEPEEIPRLEALFKRGQENNCKDIRIIGPDEIKQKEPHCRGLMAITSPHTGIVDWGEVTRCYGKNFEAQGGDIYCGFEVSNFGVTKESQEVDKGGLDYPVTVHGKNGEVIRCKHVVTCGGLFADRLAKLSGCDPLPHIVPFRGDYLLLKPEKSHLVNGNIYPVPNPKFPWLGVHFTPRLDGSIWLGPNAILALKREGYSMFDFSLKDVYDSLSFIGLRKMMFRNFRFGVDEIYRGVFISAQVKKLQRFIPELKTSDVVRGPSGVRAQALTADGQMVDDFVFNVGVGDVGSRVLHVRNAPSPAATSSLSIAKMIADKIQDTFTLGDDKKPDLAEET